MRKTAVTIVLLVLVSCASAARQYRVTGQVAIDDPFAEAQALLSEMGYTVVDAERDAGLLVAEKEQSGKGIMGMGIHVHRLTVNIMETGNVSVTASTKYGDEVEEPTAGGVSDEAMRDADQLRRHLTEGG